MSVISVDNGQHNFHEFHIILFVLSVYISFQSLIINFCASFMLLKGMQNINCPETGYCVQAYALGVNLDMVIDHVFQISVRKPQN